jgi:hypothetical protein
MRDALHINFFISVSDFKAYVPGSFRLLSARLNIIKYKTLNVPVIFMVPYSNGRGSE